jgi:proteasome lid subunit RPN8/RPN11
MRLPPVIRRAVIAHALRDRPRECCGLLVGRGGRVEFSVAMANVARGISRFEIDPAGHIALRRVLRSMTPPLEIVGVYHSHPRGPAVPSATDAAEAWYPEWLHVVVGLAGRRPEVGVFRIARSVSSVTERRGGRGPAPKT